MIKFKKGLCPVCGEKLHIARLSCSECQAEYPIDTELSVLDYLSDEQKDFLLVYLKNEGNITSIENELGISYPTVKRMLNELLIELGLKKKDDGISIINKIEVGKLDEKTMNSDRASDIVKTKLTQAGGFARVRLQSGITCLVTLISNGEYFTSDKLPNQKMDFSIFDIVVNFLKENKGYAKKGAIRGVENNIGYGKCGKETVMYQIATKYYGKEEGETAYDPLFVISAILEWAGLVQNGYGYLRLTY